MAADDNGDLDDAGAALVQLLHLLKDSGYQFVTPTPATHARFLAKSGGNDARDLRDVLGWSMPFAPPVIDPDILSLLERAEALVPLGGDRFRCRYRISSLGGRLFVHSAFPTNEPHSVFFGPDSYRFADLIRADMARSPLSPGARLVDIGTGAGVGGIIAGSLGQALRITMSDTNAAALRLARINARAAGVEARFVIGPDLEPIADPVEMIVANPPYMIDAEGRGYRNGGEMHGAGVACRMAAAAVARLPAGGRFILYAGSAIVGGEDLLHGALRQIAEREGCAITYREIDPDVFGEELERPEYRDVERIAAVGAVITRTG